ncbi:hypothetical protein AUC43_08850 [Hymenobacter sedentarius]|jgi:hypothetical protein|uniref:Uncharacterized protein n=2 Tax=Hymenobacter TaxID=89966 RepID=A0A0U4BP39_9BACT|nr:MULTISPECIES: hypothetical protein [Hymenobacter]ALW85191.1 hypothetical protein AUC43_08850 [Hymenobacter sedentarius]MCC3154519.1 hypothetical protein [Hymenobacter sp. BT770]MDO3416417.1 hypothetical protein [Hymenobacter sp. BT770]
MQTFFTSLYSSLISIFQSQRPADYGLYKTDLFSLVGWSTLGVALLLVVAFYYLFNSALRTGMFRTTHWVLTLALAAGLGTLLANTLSKSHGAESSSYLGYFMVVNMVVASLWFLLFSVLLKRWSTYARTTPFVGPF